MTLFPYTALVRSIQGPLDAALLQVRTGEPVGSELLAAQQVGCAGIVKTKSRPTSIKTRIVAHQQQVVRVDGERTCVIIPWISSRCRSQDSGRGRV